ncbi:MAG TPA: hypothetical protein VL981_07755 [Candidatus Methylacidiphilales bacterium]|nr:hypothetical protein [Candidatus Methylacidiphilales bacterium]
MKPSTRNNSAREVQQDVEAYLLRRGEATMQDINELYPEYSITDIRLALVFLERAGKAQQNRISSDKTIWVCLTLNKHPVKAMPEWA